MDFFGKNRLIDDFRAEDFRAYKQHVDAKWGVNTVKTEIVRVKHIFHYAYDQELMTIAVRFGDLFNVEKAEIRKHKSKQGKKLFTKDEIHLLLDNAKKEMRVMILLALNCGYGPSDLGNLKVGMVDAVDGWIEYTRPKTSIFRRCKLWDETLAALLPYLRGKTKSQHVFTSRTGRTICNEDGTNYIVGRFIRLKNKIGLKQQNRGFYTLRHVFATYASNTKDTVAINHIMGHADETMAGVYSETIDDERLIAVVNMVKQRIFGT